MGYRYTTSRVSFTDAMKEFTEKHFKPIEKFLSDHEPVKITLDKDGDVFVIKCQVVSKMNKRIRAEVRNEDFYNAIVDAKDIFSKQLKKRKEKSYWSERISRELSSLVTPLNEISEGVEEPSIFVRNKVFILDSITPEEAVDEMLKMGHDWYSFRDIDNNNKISVVYRRFDGETFGLVELN